MERRLDSFSPGQKGVVKSIDGDCKIKRRLFDMGLSFCARSRLSAIPSR